MSRYSFSTSKSTGSLPGGLSAQALKGIACLCMLADHTAKAFSLSGIPRFLLSDLIGRAAFPLFCFLLVEGFFHTRNLRKYLLRLFLLALLSEIPFDLVMKKQLFFPLWQNTVFLLFAGLLMCQLLRRIRQAEHIDYRFAALLQLLCIAFFAAGAGFLHLDYGPQGICAVAAFFCFHGRLPEHPQKEAFLAAFWACVLLNGVALEEIFAFLSLIPISLCSRKNGPRKYKTAFYLFYPLHLMLLFLLQLLL